MVETCERLRIGDAGYFLNKVIEQVHEVFVILGVEFDHHRVGAQGKVGFYHFRDFLQLRAYSLVQAAFVQGNPHIYAQVVTQHFGIDLITGTDNHAVVEHLLYPLMNGCPAYTANLRNILERRAGILCNNAQNTTIELVNFFYILFHISRNYSKNRAKVRKNLQVCKNFCNFAAKLVNMRINVIIFRWTVILLFICTVYPKMSLAAAPQEADKPFVVVIDAGHGGTDPGAIGAFTQEKDLNLSVSLLAGDLIKSTHPDVEVLYTRNTDVFIPLQKRADFVNKNNANLFICIHTNASPTASVHGAETYVLGTDRLDKNLDVAMRENAVIKLESDYQTKYHGFDPNSVDSYIMFELMQNQYLDQSLNYATYLQQLFAGTIKRGDRGVRQAAFWVLLKSACPSVLVEMGFISNVEEERFLASSKGQQQVAQAICDAFSSFYRKANSLKVDTTKVVVPEEKPAQQTQPQTQVKPAQQTQPQTQVKPAQQKKPAPDPSQPLFAVQIFASHEKLAPNDSRFNGRTDCKYVQIGEWYKYYCGETNDREEAFKLSKELQAKFPGCFVIKL